MGRVNVGDIDNVIHGRLRLGSMAYLADAESADFTELKRALDATQGNLGANLITLEQAGYIAIDKTFLFRRIRRAGEHFEQAFWSGQSLEDLYRSLSNKPEHSTGALFVAAMREWKRSLEGNPRSYAGLQLRIEKVMDVTIQREIARLERYLLVLATIGSAGPFVGLFGTVWGIMTSFRAIAGQQTTSLAVVAPGIAEALFATAAGLFAAIPATILYNKFVSDVNRQAQRLEGFADEFAAILSRQIDERG